MAKFYNVCFFISGVGCGLAFMVMASSDGNADAIMFGKMTATYAGMIGGWGLYDYDQNRPRR